MIVNPTYRQTGIALLIAFLTVNLLFLKRKKIGNNSTIPPPNTPGPHVCKEGGVIFLIFSFVVGIWFNYLSSSDT